jgi:hypothetical protein
MQRQLFAVPKNMIARMKSFIFSRTENEQRLMGIAALAVSGFLLFRVLSATSGLVELFTNQQRRLEQARAELKLYSDPKESPILNYIIFKARVADLERKFNDKLKSQGSITTIEALLKKQVEDKNPTIEDSPPQSFQGGLSRIPFKISFKTGSMRSLASVLRRLEEGDETFSVSKVRIEKTYQKYLQVDIDASSLTKG